MWSLSDDVHRRAGEPHSLGHHSNLLFMDPALYMLRLPTAPCTTLTICVCMRRKRRESCRRPLDPASACSRRQSGHAGVHTLARHRARHADGCERCGCVGSRLGAVRCALAPVRVSWSGVRRPRCGPERPRCGKGAGVVMLDHTGGTVCSSTPHCTRGSARTCLHAYVPETAEYPEVGACRISGVGFTFEPCHVSGCLEHAKTHRNRLVVVVFSQSIVRKSL